MNNPQIGVLGIIFSVGLLLVIVIGLSSGEPTGYAIFKSSLTKTGSLYVSSNPKGANVYVDNVYKGTTPTTISLSTGSHDVKVTKSGYNDYISTVTISSGTTTNFDVILPLPQSKLGIKTASPAQVSDIPSPYPAERQQDIRKRSNATEQLTATAPPPKPKQASDSGVRATATAPPPRPVTALYPSKYSEWYAVFPNIPRIAMGVGVGAESIQYYVSVVTLNLGSPVGLCQFIKSTLQWDDSEYSPYCTEPIGSLKARNMGANEYNCAGDQPQVPCGGYIMVYSEDRTQPILPGGLFCVRDFDERLGEKMQCASLHFVPKSDIIEYG